MPFATNSNYSFDAQTVTRVAPSQSGVYGIYNQYWQYVGETNDIARRLLEHLNETGTPLARSGATRFTFELCAANARIQRQNALILELRPSCNQKLG